MVVALLQPWLYSEGMETTQNTTKYTLVVTKHNQPEVVTLMPTYEVFVRKSIVGGVDGPFTNTWHVSGMGAVVALADEMGFAVEGFPTVYGDTAEYALSVKG